MRFTEEPSVIEGDYQRPHFLVCIPTLGMVPIHFVVAFARLQMPVNCRTQSLVITKTEVGEARNYSAEFVLNMKPRPDYLLFVGDDMLPPWDAVIKLFQEMRTDKWDVLAGLYYIKQEELPIPIIWRKDVPMWLEPYVHYTPGEVVPVDVVGMDMTMIKPSVFEKVSFPWFRTGPTLAPDGKTVVSHTEDTFFCDKVREAKLKIGCHTGIRVGHYDVRTGMVF